MTVKISNIKAPLCLMLDMYMGPFHLYICKFSARVRIRTNGAVPLLVVGAV